MVNSQVLAFGENSTTMSIADGLAFIERTRRQLDRFDVALPHDEGKAIDPVEAKEIRLICNKVEADIRVLLGMS